MTALAPVRVGWCPGALRPMASGDGLILRVKPRDARLDLAQARCIAAVARRFGNGALDLTSRANIQIRGVDDASFDAAIAVLDAAGLIDPNPAVEAVRNIVASPLAGHDPAAVVDIRPVVEALEARLETDTALHALPAKFSVVVDDGGAFGLHDVPADIRFRAVLGDTGPVFAILLAADECRAFCPIDALPDGFAALARVFITAHEADDGLHRMRHLVARDGAAAVFGRAGFPFAPLAGSRWRAAPDEGKILGQSPPHPPLRGTFSPKGKKGEAGVLDVAAPFGRMDVAQFDALIEATARAGGSDLRLTPWRAILVPGLEPEALRGAAATCAEAGLIVDGADPRRAVAACPGAPDCRRGTTPVLDHAAHLARTLRPWLGRDRIALHLSGCGKGCAHAGAAPLTLVGHDGLYDIVVDGAAADPPAIRSLSIEAAEQWVLRWFGEGRS